MQQLRQHLKQPFGLPSTKWMLEIGAVFLQTETELILKSRRVISTKLESTGFRFQFSELKQTLEDLI
jgi:NAD dependent epimerase/dehydratase family enzyme